jgi:hypothetical protein
MRPTRRRLGTLAFAICAAVVAAAAAGHTSVAGARSTGALPNPFTISARWSAKSLGLTHPKYLAIGPTGNLYVTDYTQRVTEIAPGGKVVRRWGGLGSRPGKFHFIAGDPSAPLDVNASITVGPDGNVYVSDSGNARVELFTANGRFIRQFGSYGRGPSQFLLPFDLVADVKGNVYVADDTLENLRKFSPSGKVFWTIGGAMGDPDLAGHHHFTMIDSHGRILIANDDKARVSYVELNGHKVAAFGKRGEFPAGTCDATVDAAGFTYVNGCFSPPGGTGVFDPAHALVGEWPRSPLAESPRFGPNGEVFALAWNGSVLKLKINRP